MFAVCADGAAAAVAGRAQGFLVTGSSPTAALKDQRVFPQARLGDLPPALEPAGRRFANFVLAIFLGRTIPRRG